MSVTIEDFKRYRELRKRAERLTRQLDMLERSGSAETAVITGSMRYFPYTKKTQKVAGLVRNTARLEAKKDELQECAEEAATLWGKLSAFLEEISVSDYVIRETLELYYIDGIPYGDVVECLGETGDSSTPHHRMVRYMEKNVRDVRK